MSLTNHYSNKNISALNDIPMKPITGDTKTNITVNINLASGGKFDFRVSFQSWIGGKLVSVNKLTNYDDKAVQPIYVAQSKLGYMQVKLYEAKRAYRSLTTMNGETKDSIGTLDFAKNNWEHPGIFSSGTLLKPHVNFWSCDQTFFDYKGTELGYWY